MKAFYLMPRESKQATYAILPLDDCMNDQGQVVNQIGTVRARSAAEATYIAEKRGMGQRDKIWAVEVVEPGRVIQAEVEECKLSDKFLDHVC